MVLDPIGLVKEVTLSLGVRDRQRSARWYAEHLGFELLYDVPAIGWCAMSTHVAGLVMGFSDAEAPTPGGPVPTFDVVSHDRARKTLEAAGVRFDGPAVEHEGLVRLSTFFDPDGHALMLAEDMRREGDG